MMPGFPSKRWRAWLGLLLVLWGLIVALAVGDAVATNENTAGEMAPPPGTTPLTNPNWNWDEIGKHFENMYQDGNIPSDGGQDGSPVDAPYTPVDPTEWTETEIAVATGIGTTLGAGVAGLGAWLMLGQIGVGRREAFEDMGGLLRGQLPDDGFDAWKAKHQALGWKYVEENGIARFIPPTKPPFPHPPNAHPKMAMSIRRQVKSGVLKTVAG